MSKVQVSHPTHNIRIWTPIPHHTQPQPTTHAIRPLDTNAIGSDPSSDPLPLALGKLIRLLHDGLVHGLVEPDALEPNTGDFEGARGVELGNLVDVLRGGVFAGGNGVFDDGLDRLMMELCRQCYDKLSVRKRAYDIWQIGPFLLGEVVKPECSIDACIIPYSIFVIEAFYDVEHYQWTLLCYNDA